MPDTKPDDLAADLEKLEKAAKLPDDAGEIAADDQGATAMAGKLAEVERKAR